jgi:hypothetical protein
MAAEYLRKALTHLLVIPCFSVDSVANDLFAKGGFP